MHSSGLIQLESETKIKQDETIGMANYKQKRLQGDRLIIRNLAIFKK